MLLYVLLCCLHKFCAWTRNQVCGMIISIVAAAQCLIKDHERTIPLLTSLSLIITSTAAISNCSDNNEYLEVLDRKHYQHMLRSEITKRPQINYIEAVWTDITSALCSVIIDGLAQTTSLVQVSDKLLHLAVNYMDQYLSCKAVRREDFVLVVSACLLIASKHKYRVGPKVYRVWFQTTGRYTGGEIVQMEAEVLKALKYEMSSPTPKCFICDEALADYLADLSLLEYDMVWYAPSEIAAASVFLVNYE